MAHDVFISYSSQDKTVADAVCASLEARKIRCWIAPRDVPPGTRWADALVDAIGASRVFVLVFSEGANRSEQVIREVGEAIGHGIPVLPLRIQDVEPSKGMKYYIQSIHWLEALTPPLEQHLGKLGDSVQALLGAEAGQRMPFPAPLPVEPIARPQEAAVLGGQSRRRWPLPVWGTVVLGLLLLAGLGVGIWQAAGDLRATPTRAQASTSVPTVTAAAAPLPAMATGTTESTAMPLPATLAPTAPALTTSAPAPAATRRALTDATPAASIHVTLAKIMDVEGAHVAWSPDGQWLVIGHREIQFYEAQSLEQVRAIPADRWVGGMAFSPDGRVLAAMDETRGVMLFDAASGRELHTLPRTTTSTSAASSAFLAFSPDSSTLAVILGETAKLFDVAAGQEVGTLVIGHANAIVFSGDGQSLYVGGSHGVTVYELAGGTQQLTMGSTGQSAYRIALSLDGTLLATGGSFRDPIGLWEVETGRQVGSLTGHTEGITDLVFSPDGRLLASAARDVTIRLWDVTTGTLLQTLVGHTKAVDSIGFSPDGAILATGTFDDGVRLWGVAP